MIHFLVTKSRALRRVFHTIAHVAASRWLGGVLVVSLGVAGATGFAHWTDAGVEAALARARPRLAEAAANSEGLPKGVTIRSEQVDVELRVDATPTGEAVSAGPGARLQGVTRFTVSVDRAGSNMDALIVDLATISHGHGRDLLIQAMGYERLADEGWRRVPIGPVESDGVLLRASRSTFLGLPTWQLEAPAQIDDVAQAHVWSQLAASCQTSGTKSLLSKAQLEGVLTTIFHAMDAAVTGRLFDVGAASPLQPALSVLRAMVGPLQILIAGVGSMTIALASLLLVWRILGARSSAGAAVLGRIEVALTGLGLVGTTWGLLKAGGTSPVEAISVGIGTTLLAASFAMVAGSIYALSLIGPLTRPGTGPSGIS